MKTLLAVVLLFTLVYCQQGGFSGSQTYADVVYIIDEDVMYSQQIQTWFTNVTHLLEQSLKLYGIGNVTGNNAATNLYGLVLFGGSNVTPRKVIIGGKQLMSPDVFLTNNLLNYRSSQSGSHDGWSAINAALTYPFRSGSSRVFILVTNHWRDTVDKTITRNNLLMKLRQLDVILNVVVNSSFVLPGNMTNNMIKEIGLLFINEDRQSYYINQTSSGSTSSSTTSPTSTTSQTCQTGSSGGSTGGSSGSSINYEMDFILGGRINAQHSSLTTVDDYVSLAEQLSRENCNYSSNFVLNGAFDISYIIKKMLLPQFNQLFTTLINLEILASSISLSQTNLPIPFPQPIPSPIQAMCPFNMTGLFGHQLFYVLSNTLMTNNEARQACNNTGGELANITEENTLFVQQFASTNGASDQPAWVGSWDGDYYNNTPLAYLRGSITARSQTDKFVAICEASPIPPQCLSP